MSVVIRLSRAGRKNLPFYHIGVYNSRTRREGAAIEELGFYDPVSNAAEKIRINIERVKFWIEQGAKPSDTVASFLRKQGVTAADWNGKANKPRKAAKAAGEKKAAASPATKRVVKARKAGKGRTASSALTSQRARAKAGGAK